MELHHLEYKKKRKNSIGNKNREVETQKEELKLKIENWKSRKKIDVFIQSVKKKNRLLNGESFNKTC